MKLNAGCGGTILDGWRNMDIMFTGEDHIDITKPLPFTDNSAEFVVCCHCVEHTLPAQALAFFKECFRILIPGGVMRITVPSIGRVWAMADDEYLAWLESSGFGKANRRSAVENLIVNHGHLAVWGEDTLAAAIYAAGFDTKFAPVGNSIHKELVGVEGHGKVIGEHNNWIESICVEGTKP